eukprot:10537772-Karenia_brevis.AAC.1
MFMDKMFQQESKNKVKKQEESRRVTLEEKYFRRMSKFGGEMSQFRMWMFNLGVALSTVDRKPAEEIKMLIRRDDHKKLPEDWNPKTDREIDKDTYSKYSSELYGVLVSLVEGEPLGILRGLQDTKSQYDGHKAIVMLSQRF